jgi:biotin synthase
MITDAGFEVEGTDQVTLPEHRVDGGCAPCGDSGGSACATPEPRTEPHTEPRTDLVAVRRRGAGTDLAPNA